MTRQEEALNAICKDGPKVIKLTQEVLDLVGPFQVTGQKLDVEVALEVIRRLRSLQVGIELLLTVWSLVSIEIAIAHTEDTSDDSE